MSHKRNGNYKTEKDEWETPRWLFDLLDAEFHFGLDAAASDDNHKCTYYITKEMDAMYYGWTENEDGPISSVFVNPPFSKGNIDRFMGKSLEESKKDVTVVCLVPAASDTNWWHDYVMKAREIRFIKGRVRYVGYDEYGLLIRNSPTFASCVVVFQQKTLAEALENPYAPYIGRTIDQPKASVPA